ncbi:CmpA/NrtA family ABC transporter substrate-binding protein [Zavarzinia sp.]|uniref:CmpA/NrtA family ABC transporter substrate-binding protein n=1 Tax=Zavarzinia sp. TaxID=2027920 RepID=UPI003568E9EF
MTASAPTVTIRAGFIPLLDAAILILAKTQGFAEEEGIDLVLVREHSWANIRDRVALGHFDVAHMLAPMPIAASLGLTPLGGAVITPMCMGLGGNAITVSNAVWHGMTLAGADNSGDPMLMATALRQVVEARKAAGLPRLTFAVVHPYSSHNYELRYWLAAVGIDPRHDIALTVVPPPYMSDALAGGHIDGYCVGEPWNSASVVAGVGHIATTTTAIWRSSPEKVLGMRLDWAERNPEAASALLRAMHRASVWADSPKNAEAIVDLLSSTTYLDVAPSTLMAGLTGRIALGAGQPQLVPEFRYFSRRAATFPWISHGLWFFSQMVRWGQAELTPQTLEIARKSVRPDIYRRALGPLGVALPNASAKVEGTLTMETPVATASGRLFLGPDGFFDGRVFDPDLIEDYVASFEIKGPGPLEG